MLNNDLKLMVEPQVPLYLLGLVLRFIKGIRGSVLGIEPLIQIIELLNVGAECKADRRILYRFPYRC
jgi:hypothetical protein